MQVTLSFIHNMECDLPSVVGNKFHSVQIKPIQFYSIQVNQVDGNEFHFTKILSSSMLHVVHQL